jgi:hypothetical protein
MNGLTNLRKKKYQLAALTILSVTLAAVSGCRTAQPILESVIVKDTVIVTETKYLLDTLEILKDTTIYQDKVRLQLKYIDRKVVVEAACLPDTIRVTQTKVLTKQEPKKKGWSFDEIVFTLAFILVFAYFIKKWIDRLVE